MPIGRGPEAPIRPVRHLAELDRYVGKWVAIKEGHVLTFADSSTDLALRLRQREDARGAVIQFVRPDLDAYIVGVG